MDQTLMAGQSVPVSVAPVTDKLDANGIPIPSKAALSNLTFVSSDTTIFTVVPDPANPLGAIVTASPSVTSDVSAILTASATATEPDGTTQEHLADTTTINVTVTPPPPPPPAAHLVFTFGTPTP